MLIRAGLLAAVAAGAVGVLLDVAGIASAVVSVLIVLFIVVARTTAIAGMLRGFGGLARAILASPGYHAPAGQHRTGRGIRS